MSRDQKPSFELIIQRCDERSAAILREAEDCAICCAKNCDLELTILREADNHRSIRLTCEVQVDQQNRPVVIWGSIQDVTRQRKLELELRHAQKMEAVGELASGIAHEFNNLISTVSGHVDHARQSIPSDGPAADSLAHLAEAMERAFGLARGLLAFSRKTAPRRELVDIATVVEQAEKLLRRSISKRIDLKVRTSPGHWTSADPSQLLQVILNLSLNARDAMPDGGTLTIEVERAAGFVQITVADTGEGIPEPVLRRIFEPFFTTKPTDAGTGLGLALSRGIVEDHDGQISVKSEPGQGAVFTVLLPLAQPEEPVAPLVNDRQALLVEAQPFARSLVTTILSELGYKVVVARDIEQALAMCPEVDLAVISAYGPLIPLVESVSEADRGDTHVILIISGDADSPTVPQGVTVVRRPFRSSDVAAAVAQGVQ